MIYKLDKATEDVIKAYPDLRSACNELRVEPRQIRRAIRGVQVTAYGFKWSQRAPVEKAVARRRVEDVLAAKETSGVLGVGFDCDVSDINGEK